MPLRFRNIEATPDDPVASWGFEGMLAAIDRGYAEHWTRLASAVAADPGLEPTFEDAAVAAESRSTVRLIRALIEHDQRDDRERAVQRLRHAFAATGLTQRELAARLGTSRSRLSTYLSGSVSPSMDVLVAVERLADEQYALRSVPELVLR